MNESVFNFTNRTQSKLPRLPFLYIKEKILGKEYKLDLSFIPASKQKELNFKFRKINKSTNILSFPLSDKSGEITIDPAKAKKDAPLFEMPYSIFLKYLFIHGCLHLKGLEHSSIMEEEEKKYLKIFS